jgi:hypothetical protein
MHRFDDELIVMNAKSFVTNVNVDLLTDTTAPNL